jgi:hypothetical protein
MWQKLARNFLEAWKKPRWRVAAVIAVLSDAVAYNPLVALVPPMEWLLDGVTAVALFAALGFRWLMLPALLIEAVPGLMLFPFWTLAVAAMAATEDAAAPGGDGGKTE